MITLVLVGLKPPNIGTSTGVQFLKDESSSFLVSPSAAFSFRAFGYRVILPEYAPGYAFTNICIYEVLSFCLWIMLRPCTHKVFSETFSRFFVDRRWIYFWLLMAAGFGLFISEEALNVWVRISTNVLSCFSLLYVLVCSCIPVLSGNLK